MPVYREKLREILEKLKDRWNLTSLWQVVVILIVFALTGTTVLFLKRPLVAYFSPEGEQNTWFSVGYYVLIWPIYNIILLGYGYVLGQFSFFWEFEKKTYYRITKRFKKKELPVED